MSYILSNSSSMSRVSMLLWNGSSSERLMQVQLRRPWVDLGQHWRFILLPQGLVDPSSACDHIFLELKLGGRMNIRLNQDHIHFYLLANVHLSDALNQTSHCVMTHFKKYVTMQKDQTKFQNISNAYLIDPKLVVNKNDHFTLGQFPLRSPGGVSP
jgi:hypothetical protein